MLAGTVLRVPLPVDARVQMCTAEASKQLRVPMPFLTTIVVPLVGNAAEHASAVVFAVKNRMEISLGVAMGEHSRVSWVSIVAARAVAKHSYAALLKTPETLGAGDAECTHAQSGS